MTTTCGGAGPSRGVLLNQERKASQEDTTGQAQTPTALKIIKNCRHSSQKKRRSDENSSENHEHVVAGDVVWEKATISLNNFYKVINGFHYYGADAVFEHAPKTWSMREVEVKINSRLQEGIVLKKTELPKVLHGRLRNPANPPIYRTKAIPSLIVRFRRRFPYQKFLYPRKRKYCWPIPKLHYRAVLHCLILPMKTAGKCGPFSFKNTKEKMW